MYLYQHRAAPAQNFLSEAAPAVTSVPLTKVFGTGSTAMFPFSAVCRIEVRGTKGTSVGSGVLITPHHVLTCAHVLFDRNDPNPRKITVLPNHDGADDKRQPIPANAWAPRPGFQSSECRTHDNDLAILRLTRKADADFWPIQNFNPAVIATGAITLAGYPAFSPTDKAYFMHRSQGTVLGGFGIVCCADAWPKKCDPPPHRQTDQLVPTGFGPINDATKLIAHTLDTKKCMSGGPMWIYDNKKPILVALHAGTFDRWEYKKGKYKKEIYKKAVLLNPTVRALINHWLTRQYPFHA
jgi:V8-like Glu-specific endopeptidase